MFLGVSHLFDPALEVPLTVLGVSLVVVAHALNLRGELIPSVIQAFGVETQDGGGQN
jgi:hypothetical protein